MALQEAHLSDRTVRIMGLHLFYNSQYLRQAILMQENLTVYEVDISKWDSDALQVHSVRVQTPVPLVFVNVHACNGKFDVQRQPVCTGRE